MPLYPVPHSPEWFLALESFDSGQASHTRQIVKSAGRSDVCSICGDRPTADYKVVGESFLENAVGTIRLCGDCRTLREAMQGEKYQPFRPV